jgi:hypothetical protein
MGDVTDADGEFREVEHARGCARIGVARQECQFWAPPGVRSRIAGRPVRRMQNPSRHPQRKTRRHDSVASCAGLAAAAAAPPLQGEGASQSLSLLPRGGNYLPQQSHNAALPMKPP